MRHADEAEIEAVIAAKSLVAPRVTPQMIDSLIVTQAFHVFPGTCLTVCCLTLKNGFNVLGESACASPENFDGPVGKMIAFQNAREKIWPLAGYALRCELAAEKERADEPL